MMLKERIAEDMKSAMRARDSARLGAIRLLMAAVKQKEVDERIELDDDAVIAVIGRMLKQRRDSISQFDAAGRTDLSDKEKAECAVLEAYMPPALTAEDLAAILDEAIASTGAAGIRDLGKVMAVVKPLVAGKADLSEVSALAKSRLG